MFVIVGLGNPGEQYKDTRHNVGFMVIDRLSEKLNIKVNRLKFKALLGEGLLEDKKIMLVKPMTYMNLSGQSVLEIVNWYKIPKENLLIIYDDVSLDLGKIRIRRKGSSGGQKGMESIIYLLNSEEIPRLRIGIGSPKDGDLPGYVLQEFSKEEKETLKDVIERACNAVCVFIAEGINAVMNKFNG